MKTMFFTGKGDSGVSYVGKQKVDKGSTFVELLGLLDECNSAIGVATASTKNTKLQDYLLSLQNMIFVAQAEVAVSIFGGEKKYVIKQEHIKRLENVINEIDKLTPKLTNFVIPGGTLTAAHCDFARSFVRRIERFAVKHNKILSNSSDMLAFLNRASSYLFACARYANLIENFAEIAPNYE